MAQSLINNSLLLGLPVFVLVSTKYLFAGGRRQLVSVNKLMPPVFFSQKKGGGNTIYVQLD